MIDLHFHLLPGVDDGASDLEEARQMCRLAAEDGCHTLIVTPHQRHALWENRNRHRLEEILNRVRTAAGEGLNLHLGAEIHVDSDLLDDLDRLGDEGPIPLAGSRYLLLELDRSGQGPDPLELTHELTVGGWIPIFAHPEHIGSFAKDLSLARELVAAGALFQLTATSVVGDVGKRAREICRGFLDDGLAHFIASDAHGVSWRPPGLAGARGYVARHWGEETAWRLTEGNAAAVLERRPLALIAEEQKIS